MVLEWNSDSTDPAISAVLELAEQLRDQPIPKSKTLLVQSAGTLQPYLPLTLLGLSFIDTVYLVVACQRYDLGNCNISVFSQDPLAFNITTSGRYQGA